MAQIVTFTEVLTAKDRIAGIAVETPLKESRALSARLEAPVHLKIETMQPTGSFKLRGAANRLLSLQFPERKRGVVTASTGNHGRALAYAAGRLGIRCVVCLSKIVPANKVMVVQDLGAEVDICGSSQDEAIVRAQTRALDDGLIMIPPFDDPLIVAGQGTVGIEIIEALPDVGTIIVPISGGGLAAGIALAVKAKRPAVRIIGASSDRCPAMKRSIEAGHPVDVPEKPSLADSLGGGIGQDNRVTFAMVRDLVDEIRTVSDEEVAEAMRFAFRSERLVLEGAGATPIAVLLGLRRNDVVGPVAAVLTGDNIDPDRFLDVVSGRAPKCLAGHPP
jgi:threonine dehydratase